MNLPVPIGSYRRFPQAAALLLGAGLLAGCLDTSPPVPNQAVSPFTITCDKADLYPEGVRFDTFSQCFLVSSLTTGAVGKVAISGGYAAFINDASLVSSVGLQIDDVNNRLLVAVADPGYNRTKTSAATKNKLAALASFDAKGKLLAYVDLGKLKPGIDHYANDIAVDAQGNAYVTDSHAPIIYKVTKSGDASIFLEDPLLSAPAGEIGLNGIVFHPAGYLLVAKSDDGSLFKVPLSNPTGFTRVSVALDMKGLNGLVLEGENTLYGVSSTQALVFRLRSISNWTSGIGAGSFATPPEYPTDLTRINTTETYVLHARLPELKAATPLPNPSFRFTKLRF